VAWSDGDLLKTVKRLALAADEQAAYVRQLGSAPSLDELALEFDDEFNRLRGEGGASAVPPGYHAALSALDEQLDRMSGQDNAELWVEEALGRREWQQVRELARRALAERPRE
jgi:hypothetical protein